MDEISTHESKIDRQLLTQALIGEKYPSPAKSSLEFIRNFARNFRISNCVNGRAQELILN